MKQEHDLKIDKYYLLSKLAGDKMFEIRVNDRGYQKGDRITYREYIAGILIAVHMFEITYVTSYAQQGEYVVFGETFIETRNLQ